MCVLVEALLCVCTVCTCVCVQAVPVKREEAHVCVVCFLVDVCASKLFLSTRRRCLGVRTYVCVSGCVNYSHEAEKGVCVCVCAVAVQQEEVCVYVVYLCV